MAPTSLLSLSQRITSTSSLLLERSRVLSLNLPPSASTQNQIIRNLTLIKGDLITLEEQLENNGLTTGKPVSGKKAAGGKKNNKVKESEVERQVREMGEQYDRLVEMLAEDDIGKEKAKTLRREKKRAASPEPSAPLLDTSDEMPIPRVSIEPPTPAVNPNIPFKDYPDGEPENEDDQNGMNDHEMLSNQQMLMEDQDERLNLLSHSINRQNHLSIQIGSEIDIHNELLEDTDAAMDRTAARLSSARRRLDKVASDAKQHGSTITIVVLIFILLILIIVFKT